MPAGVIRRENTLCDVIANLWNQEHHCTSAESSHRQGYHIHHYTLIDKGAHARLEEETEDGGYVDDADRQETVSPCCRSICRLMFSFNGIILEKTSENSLYSIREKATQQKLSLCENACKILLVFHYYF